MSIGQLTHAYLAHRYAILFYSLLLTLAVGPLLAALDVDRNVIRVARLVNIGVRPTQASMGETS